MAKVIVQGHIVVPENDLLSVLAAMPQHIELTRQEKGCLVFEITPDHDLENIFYVYEEFVDQDSFEIHQTRVRISSWGQVTINVARHYRICAESA